MINRILLKEEQMKQAEQNYQEFLVLDCKMQRAAEFAGITKEQAYKFMDGLNIEYKECP